MNTGKLQLVVVGMSHKTSGIADREKFQIATLIKDMGYPLLLDRVNFGEDDILPTKPRMSEYLTQYYA